MTAHVSPDAPRPPSGIRDSGGPMPFNEADFTRTAAELVAEGDRVPEQRADESVDIPRQFMVETLDAVADEIVTRWPEAAAYIRGRARGIANAERMAG